MSPDDPLLRILVCPLDKGPLTLLPTQDALVNPRLRLRYPILDGIPQLLPSSGTPLADAGAGTAAAATGRPHRTEGEG